jgi:hypothetical protein
MPVIGPRRLQKTSEPHILASICCILPLHGNYTRGSICMVCPQCKLINPQGAERCDCGYDFVSATLLQPYSIDRTRRPFNSILEECDRGIQRAQFAGVLVAALALGTWWLVLLRSFGDRPVRLENPGTRSDSGPPLRLPASNITVSFGSINCCPRSARKHDLNLFFARTIQVIYSSWRPS